MEGLATFFVTLVLIANNIAPNSNLPERLGIITSTGVLSEETSTDSASSRETRRNALEETRRIRKKALEEAKTRREEFKNKVGEIRDQRKKEVVERIDENIGKHNEKWVEHWNKVLSRLSEILAKIKTRTDKAAGGGKDVTDVNSAISGADAAITAAQSATLAQAGKTYVIEITDEENLGENVSAVVGQFKTDIKGVQEKVKAARQAVHDAFKALKSILTPTP